MASITRSSDAASLLPEDYADGIIKNATEKSAAMQLIPHKRMSRKQQRMSVLSAFPTAAFVTGSDTDVGLKPTTNMSWANVFLNAEPIAAVVPIAEDLLDDLDYDIWGEVKPALEEAVAAVIDGAVLFGTNAPSTWGTSIVAGAVAAGNTVNAGTGVDIAADINTAMGAVEADGFLPNGFVIRMAERSILRGLRDGNRQFLFDPAGPSNTGASDAAYQGQLFGEPCYVSALGLAGFGTTVSGDTRYITGDWKQARLGIRNDIRYKMLTESTLYNSDGSVMFALAQQDMVALRLVMRIGYVTPNPITRMNTNSATRWPFAVVRVA